MAIQEATKDDGWMKVGGVSGISGKVTDTQKAGVVDFEVWASAIRPIDSFQGFVMPSEIIKPVDLTDGKDLYMRIRTDGTAKLMYGE